MKIIKDKNIIKVIEEDFCEEYCFEKEITFEKLTSYLLNKNLTVEIKIEDETNENSENEQTLINLIKEIISKYNNEVGEYQKFLKDFEDKS